MLELDDVELEFEEDALANYEKAIERKTELVVFVQSLKVSCLM
ncbi:hypothetical protein ACEQPO_20850 [Bacillus sp. SL00103]